MAISSHTYKLLDRGSREARVGTWFRSHILELSNHSRSHEGNTHLYAEEETECVCFSQAGDSPSPSFPVQLERAAHLLPAEICRLSNNLISYVESRDRKNLLYLKS